MEYIASKTVSQKEFYLLSIRMELSDGAYVSPIGVNPGADGILKALESI